MVGGGSFAIGQSAPRAKPAVVVGSLCVTKYSSSKTVQAKKKEQNLTLLNKVLLGAAQPRRGDLFVAQGNALGTRRKIEIPSPSGEG